MPWHDENTFVIRTGDIEVIKEFLESFGLTFVLEKHGNGPEHYACESGGKVLEIYPLRKAL
jgi:lactoylglutathione lyase